MKDAKIRTRFAPSPTGYMHVGNLRTALYAYLAAGDEGTFILRIEDTDQGRYVPEALGIIYETLKETGLHWQEGPDVGGDYGPYVQSERMDIYKKYAEQLISQGGAYRCFCDKERLEASRLVQKAAGKPPSYDRHCRSLSAEEIEKNLADGLPYVVRQSIPDSGSTTISDEIFGEITVENSTLDDQVLIKQDGMPTYNFANVIDDHLMEISIVIRGTEYLSSAPKYDLLYKAFGWEIPKYLHCPPVMKDSSAKLSKRTGDASYQDFIEKGYLPEAVLNYIALLGWSPGGEQEIMSLSEMKKLFNIHDVSKSPSIFDPVKLRHINGVYIRALSPEQFYRAALPFVKEGLKREDIDTEALCALLQSRTDVLSDIPEQIDFIDNLPDYDLELFTSKKMKTSPDTAAEALKALLPVLEGIPENEFSSERIHTDLMELIATLGVKNGIILWPLRVAVSGKQFTPGGGTEMAALLGKAQSISRVKTALSRLEAAGY